MTTNYSYRVATLSNTTMKIAKDGWGNLAIETQFDSQGNVEETLVILIAPSLVRLIVNPIVDSKLGEGSASSGGTTS